MLFWLNGASYQVYYLSGLTEKLCNVSADVQSLCVPAYVLLTLLPFLKFQLLSGVHTAHDIVRHRTTSYDVVRRRPMSLKLNTLI